MYSIDSQAYKAIQYRYVIMQSFDSIKTSKIHEKYCEDRVSSNNIEVLVNNREMFMSCPQFEE